MQKMCERFNAVGCKFKKKTGENFRECAFNVQNVGTFFEKQPRKL